MRTRTLFSLGWVVQRLKECARQYSNPTEHACLTDHWRLTMTSEPKLQSFAWHLGLALDIRATLGVTSLLTCLVALQDRSGSAPSSGYYHAMVVPSQPLHIEWHPLKFEGIHAIASVQVVYDEIPMLYAMITWGTADHFAVYLQMSASHT